MRNLKKVDTESKEMNKMKYKARLEEKMDQNEKRKKKKKTGKKKKMT